MHISSKIKKSVWCRCSREYLNELQIRSKWKKILQILQVGQLMLLKEGTEKFRDWKLPWITKIYKGVMDVYV